MGCEGSKPKKVKRPGEGKRKIISHEKMEERIVKIREKIVYEDYNDKNEGFEEEKSKQTKSHIV